MLNKLVVKLGFLKIILETLPVIILGRSLSIFMQMFMVIRSTYFTTNTKFLHPLKISENPLSFDVFKGYRKWNIEMSSAYFFLLRGSKNYEGVIWLLYVRQNVMKNSAAHFVSFCRLFNL